jgi:uncharacterized membrane protein YvbJ
MNKHYIFIGMVFFLAFLVIQFVITGYNNSQREETLRIRENEIVRDEAEIARLTTRAKWGDTAAARVYLKKLNNDVRLPGERVLVLTEKIMSGEYSVDQAITAAKKEEQIIQEMTIPEKWNALIWGN